MWWVIAASAATGTTGHTGETGDTGSPTTAETPETADTSLPIDDPSASDDPPAETAGDTGGAPVPAPTDTGLSASAAALAGEEGGFGCDTGRHGAGITIALLLLRRRGGPR